MELPILNLERPLVFFDIESTGLSIETDRIIEIGIIKVYPHGRTEEISQRFNPGITITPASTMIHGISNDDVKDMPRLCDYKDCSTTWAQYISALFDGADIAGFNSYKFDVPLLSHELNRNGAHFNIKEHRQVDALKIYHKFEKRTLADAYRLYLGRELEGAHSAMVDTRATYEIVRAQVARYDEIENNIYSLVQNSNLNAERPLENYLTLDAEGKWVFQFSKFKGRRVEDVPSMARWMISKDFPAEVKNILIQIINNLPK